MRVIPHGCLRLMLLASAVWLPGALAGEPAPTQSPRSTDRTPALSVRLTDAVAARLPRYVSNAAEPVAAASQGGDDSLEGIMYLPKMTITTAKMPPTTSYDLLTPKGRLELALKKNPGLRLGPLARLNDGIAMAIEREEREARKREELKAQVLSIAIGDAARSAEEVRAMRAATARPNTDWQSRSPGRE